MNKLFDISIVNSIVDKFYNIDGNALDSNKNIYTLDELFAKLNENECNLIYSFLSINPYDYGFKGKFLGIFPVPKKLVIIKDQKYIIDGEEMQIVPQYCPKEVYIHFVKMIDEMDKDIGKTLLVDSCYRSPASQILTFLFFLKYHDFDFTHTISLVAFPGYSEHGDPVHQAIDVITTEGLPKRENPQDFENTIEYKWLMNHANKFNFYLSYPKNNKEGIAFEPWHWKYVIK